MILVSATSVAAKGWRGIVPFVSTRKDVEAVLGLAPPPSADPLDARNNKRVSTYSLDDGEVQIIFADHSSSESECSSAIPSGTVTLIRVTPKNAISVADLKIDEKGFTRVDRGESGIAFTDEAQGFAISTVKGKVREMLYIASASDRVRCPGYYTPLESLLRDVISTFKFDEYGDIRFSDEKTRLDNLAIQLSNDKDAVGYIIVYAGRKATVAEAQLRATRARDYLINVREISPERIKAIDGGHQEEFTVQLYIAPSGAEAPPLSPTIDPSKGRDHLRDETFSQKGRVKHNNVSASVHCVQG